MRSAASVKVHTSFPVIFVASLSCKRAKSNIIGDTDTREHIHSILKSAFSLYRESA